MRTPAKLQARSASARNPAGKVVYAALAGNLAIALVKFLAFLFTRSTAMLTESVHSLVDTGDELLLLVGQHRARKPADPTHPFGYGMETYFWSFIVSLMVFFAGGVVSIWRGCERFLHPEPLDRIWLSYLVLAFSAVSEAWSFRVGYREFRRFVQGRDLRLLRFMKMSKDPNLFATMLEDGAALTGLALAALGITGSAVLGLYWADGAASVAIGLLLLGVALFLANETRSLLDGESAAPAIVEAARQAVETDERVETVREVSSLHLGPQHILIGLTLRFRSGLSGDQIQTAALELTERVRATDPRIGKVYLRPGEPETPSVR